MTESQTRIALTDAQFAHLGEGEVAYFRKVSTDELRGQFPGIAGIQPGTELWRFLPPTASRSYSPTSASACLPAP